MNYEERINTYIDEYYQNSVTFSNPYLLQPIIEIEVVFTLITLGSTRNNKLC